MDKIKNIVLVGAGNVATHLGLAFRTHGIVVSQIYSRSKESAKRLSELLECPYTTSMSKLVGGADLYIFALSDDVLQSSIENFPHKNAFLVHTSGSMNINIFANKPVVAGVFYPLQTFSKNTPVMFDDVPVCIEADTPAALQLLSDLGQAISSDVRAIDSDQRMAIHLAAVFACNFTNHMLSLADQLLESKNISSAILNPLIRETFHKATLYRPRDIQTGPAKRRDETTMQKHVQLLTQKPELQKLYTFISLSIQNNT